MIAVTSISPTHINKDIQSVAVKSWIDCGMEVYSFNNKAECKLLAPQYPDVKFIETERTLQLTFGKPYVSISGIFNWCKASKFDSFCLINSDIELRTDKDTINRIKNKVDENSIVLANRVNYSEGNSGSRYLDGIDVFFFDKNIAAIYPETCFCLGQCFFDYFIPYWASKSGYNLIFLKQDIAFHKNHQAQYKHEHWVKTGHHFMWLTDLWQFSGQVGRMSRFVYEYIYNSSKRIEI